MSVIRGKIMEEISDGVVSFKDDETGIRELALFAGAGGGILGGKLLGWRTVCAVEINQYCIDRLMQRQDEGFLPPFPIFDDVCKFNGISWNGKVDVISGGFPCQDISASNNKAEGITGKRSGLWSEFARIIDEVRPRFCFVENSPLLLRRGLDRVLSDLAEMRYDVVWANLSAKELGASHKRDRIWILASNAASNGLEGSNNKKNLLGPTSVVAQSLFPHYPHELSSSRIVGTSNGVADRMDRTRAIGNGQVPIVAATAWNLLIKRFNK
jgi:DNA (cytosine-5)-methyltransferase 1